MYVERHTVQITTDAEQAGLGHTPVVTGRVVSVSYIKDDYAAGVDFDVTAEFSGATIWSEEDVDASKVVHPAAQLHGTDGVALVLNDADDPLVGRVYVAQERVKIVVANGGVAKTGTFVVLVA